MNTTVIVVAQYRYGQYYSYHVYVKVQDIDDSILTVKKSKTSMTLPLNC